MAREVWRGELVVLRRPRPADQGAFLAAVAASRDLHHPWVAPPSTPLAFTAYLHKGRRRNQEALLAIGAADGELVGVVNINEIIRGGFQSGYLGYYGFAGHCGGGRMTEAVAGAVAHAFGPLGLHRVEANIQPANEPSRRLVQRLGFRLEGLSPAYLRIAGAWRDHERWARTVDDPPPG